MKHLQNCLLLSVVSLLSLVGFGTNAPAKDPGAPIRGHSNLRTGALFCHAAGTQCQDHGEQRLQQLLIRGVQWAATATVVSSVIPDAD